VRIFNTRAHFRGSYVELVVSSGKAAALRLLLVNNYGINGTDIGNVIASNIATAAVLVLRVVALSPMVVVEVGCVLASCKGPLAALAASLASSLVPGALAILFASE